MSEDLTKTEENANAQASQGELRAWARLLASKANVNIIVDSCADFAPEVVEALGVEVVSFSFVMGGQEHADDFWKSMSPHDFYERMRAGEVATTAAVTPGHYLEVFERAAQKGTPTIYLALRAALCVSWTPLSRRHDPREVPRLRALRGGQPLPLRGGRAPCH